MKLHQLIVQKIWVVINLNEEQHLLKQKFSSKKSWASISKPIEIPFS